MANMSKMIVQFIADTTSMQAGMAQMEAGIASLQTNAQKTAMYASGGFAQVGGALQTAGAGFSAIGSSLTRNVTLPLVGLGAIAMKTSIDFETAFAGVRKTVDEGVHPVTGAITDFETLRQKIMAISRETGVAMEDVAGIMQVAGQLGIRGNEALGNFTGEVARLGITTGLSTDHLAMMLGKFLAISGLSAEDDIAMLSNVITDLGNNSATTEGEILKFGVRIAAVGRLVGISAEDILAIATSFESTGTKAERGGTAFTKIMLKMQAEALGSKEAIKSSTSAMDGNNKMINEWTQKLEQAKEAQANLGSNATAKDIQRLSAEIATATENIAYYKNENEELKDTMGSLSEETVGFAKLLGMTQAEFSSVFKDDASGAFQLFIGKINEAQVEGKDLNQVMKDLGLTDARLIQAVLSLAQANEGGNVSLSALVNTMKTADGAAFDMNATMREVEKRLDTVSGQWGILKEILKSFAVLFTDESSGVLKEYLKSINEFLQGVLTKLQAMSPEQIKGMVDMFIKLAALGPAMSILGKAMTTIGGSMKFMSGLGNIFKMGNMDPKDMTNIIKGAGFMPSEVPAEMARINKTWAAKLGKNFGDAWGKSAFNPDNLKPKVEKFTKDLDDLQWRLLEGSKKRFSADATGTHAERYRDSAGRFAGSKMVADGAVAGAGSGPGFTAVAAQPSALSVALSKVIALIPAAVAGMTQIALVLGVAAVALGAIVGGITLMAVLSGKTAEQVKSDFEGSVAGIKAFFDGFTAKMQGLRDGLPAFFAKMGEMFPVVLAGVTNVVIEAIKGLAQLIPQFILLAGEFLDGMITGFFNNLPEIIDSVIEIGKALLIGFVHILPSIIEAGARLVFSLISGILSAIPALTVGVLKVLAAIVEVLWTLITDGTLLEFARAIFIAIIEGIFSMLEALIEAFLDIWDNVWKSIKDFWGLTKGAASLMGSMGKDLLMGLMAGILYLWEDLKKLWATVSTYLVKAWDGAEDWLYNAGKAILGGLWAGIKWYFETLFKTYFNVGKWILDAFIGSGNWLVDVGKNIMLGLKKGIFEIGGQMGRWVSELGGNFVNGVKNFFGIKSPSRVMMQLGGYIGEGMALGIEDSTSDVLNASKALENAAMIDPSLMDMNRNIDGTVKHDYSGIAEAFIEALEAVGLNVFIDGDDITDQISKRLVLQQRRGR